METIERVLRFAGGVNFRDLGGYRTIDGRVIRRGRLFRSGVLSYLKSEDREALARLGLQLICDLRRLDERRREPTDWPHTVEIRTWDDDPSDPDRHRGLDWTGLTSASVARQRMVDLYSGMPKTLRSRVRVLIEHLAAGRAPLLFHCSAGKDRTGFCAAIVLHGLGVPRETILEDYELTNSAVDLAALVRRHYTATLGLSDPDHPLNAVTSEVLSPITRADREYLIAAFDRIDAMHGSVDAYLRDDVGVSEAALEAMRKTLLTGEPATSP